MQRTGLRPTPAHPRCSFAIRWIALCSTREHPTLLRLGNQPVGVCLEQEPIGDRLTRRAFDDAAVAFESAVALLKGRTRVLDPLAIDPRLRERRVAADEAASVSLEEA